MLRTSALWLWLPLGVLLAASCGSEGDGGRPGDQAGAGGEPTGNAGEPGTAASSQGASSSNGGSGAGNAAGDNGGHAGAPLTTAGAPTSGSGGAQGGASPELGGAGGAAGANEAIGGAPPLVAEASCLQHEDCLAVCQANGWPQAHCFGSSERYCSCESSSGGPSCIKGTTEGCPTGTACRGPHQCMPFGEGAHGEPCDNGDECAPGLICVGFGNPLPNGKSTACATMCEPQTAAPGCDCLAGYCWGGLGLYDFSCDFPTGTPCDQSVAGNDTKRGHITGTNEIAPGHVYIVSVESPEDVDLEVCGSKSCQGDNLCVSNGATGSESCIVQATQDSLDVYVVNKAGGSASVAVNVEADVMNEYKLSYTKMSSSLADYRSLRLLVTGLTPGQKYEFNVATANARDINLVVSSDLHGEQELCNEDLVGAAAACELTVTQAAVWVVLTDTSGIGDGFTFKVTAK
jgi:hypothetical protein